MIAIICISQPNGNCIMYNLTALQAEEFLGEVTYVFISHQSIDSFILFRKFLDVFKHSEEFGWEVEKKGI